MSRSIIARYVNPWKFRREQEEVRRVSALRQRDGDECRRCRKPMRFDLPGGYDQAPRIAQFAPAAGDEAALDDLCLTDVRCNAQGADNTAEVSERIRRKNEAELFAKSKRRA
jgi:hypothetical protein